MKNTWCVLIKTESGNVSFLRSMTENEANEVRKRLNPYRGNPSFIQIRPSTIIQIEVFDGSVDSGSKI